MLKAKAVRVLQILQDGHFIEDKEGRKYYLIDNKLCTEVEKLVLGVKKEPEIIMVDADFSLKSFLDFCESFTDDYLFLKGCETVLMRQARRQSESRLCKKT